MLEFIILILIAIFIIVYRKEPGEGVYKFFVTKAVNAYDRYAPFSFKLVRQKAVELGQEFTTRQYMTQIALIGGFAAFIVLLFRLFML